MQGRLVDSEKRGRIQYFPEKNWIKEMKLANLNNFRLMEWTIDKDNINKNPLYNKILFNKFFKEKKKYNIKIPSATCDFFMQNPFYKLNGKKKIQSIKNLRTVIINGKILKIKFFVIPLLDKSKITNKKELNEIINFFNNKKFINLLGKNSKIVFETDFSPKKNLLFIKKFPKKTYGINYDTGNSASYGYNFNEEKKFFNRVYNIHIKDRRKNGKTVRLGDGDFNFKSFFKFIKKSDYKGNFILQTARSTKKRHIEEALLNRKFIEKFI